MKDGKTPNPNVIHPIKGYDKEIYIKPTIKNPNIIVGDFSYIADSDFESHVTHHYEWRYRITLRTQGGHSYYDFGNSNAIAAAAELITKLYRVEVPRKDGSKTTYNVGTVSGGCSVNTVAQEASFLYEYRSDDYSSLATMRQTFHSIVEAFRARGLAQVTVETVGIRPCANLSDSARLREMADRAVQIVQKHTGKDCGTDAASTDCNVPLSMGIPAVCIGTYWGEGAHTREEKIRIDSLAPGLAIVAETVLDFCGEKA